MPRLFSGLVIPPPVAEQLALHRGGLPGARWIESGDYHVTLRFFGDVGTPTANEIHDALSEAPPRAPFQVTLDRLDAFGGDAPRAIYAGVAANSVLSEIQVEHERIARDAGLAPEPRKFTPHVTLARLRRVKPAAVARYLSQTGVFARITFEIDRVALFSARDSVGGGPYVVEATYPFGDVSEIGTATPV